MISPLYKPSDQIRGPAALVFVFGATALVLIKFNVTLQKLPGMDLPVPDEIKKTIAGAFVLLVVYYALLLLIRFAREHSEFVLSDIQAAAKQIADAKELKTLFEGGSIEPERQIIMARLANAMTRPLKIIEVIGYMTLIMEILAPLAFATYVVIIGRNILVEFIKITYK